MTRVSYNLLRVRLVMSDGVLCRRLGMEGVVSWADSRGSRLEACGMGMGAQMGGMVMRMAMGIRKMAGWLRIVAVGDAS